MPVPLIKIGPHPETAQRVAEVGAIIDAMARAVAPAAQKACEELGRSISALRRPA
ncbi:hypothetical protein ACFVHR_04715 [Streptomyces sp. NPDC127168]|uniref:hypothetical protein n=1 Tax=unclassified Streptomyces TaxID=2593676 RepID=UPI003630DCFA